MNDPHSPPAPAADATKTALKFLGKQVAVWVAVLAFFAGMVLMVVFGDNSDHQSSLAATITTTPVFFIQVAILAAVALVINYCILWVRARRVYDRLGAAREMLTVQGRIGTENERPGDAQAVGLQFLANTILIAVVILCFFLMRANPGASAPPV